MLLHLDGFGDMSGTFSADSICGKIEGRHSPHILQISVQQQRVVSASANGIIDNGWHVRTADI
jgi:hypothetical protein